MRIPRKKKKFYKTLWFKRYGIKRYIIKSSIDYDVNARVWGCTTRFKDDGLI